MRATRCNTCAVGLKTDASYAMCQGCAVRLKVAIFMTVYSRFMNGNSMSL